MIYFFFFFFSSRRRHTRLTCDWSSDVALPIWNASTLPWWGWPTPGRGDSEARGAPDQIGQRPGLHLLHHVPTLFLDGGFAGAELPGDLLVEQAGDGSAHHVPLARSQQVIPATDRKSTRLNSSHMSISYAVFCL